MMIATTISNLLRLVRRSVVLGSFYWILIITTWAEDTPALQTGQKVAFLGDSIAAFGWESSFGYIHLISQALAMQGRQVTVIPAGVKGDTSKTILVRLKNDILDKKPDWIVLSCGLNDVWYGTGGVSLDQYKQNVTSIIDQITASGIKPIIITSTMIGEDSSNVNNQTLETYNDFLRSVAKDKKLPLVDSYVDMRDYLTKIRGSTQTNSANFLTIDGVHLNGIGNEVIASGILKALGSSETEIAQAKAAWDELPNAITLSPIKINIRQYEQLQGLAAQHGSSAEKLANDTFMSSLTSLLSTNNAPSVSAPPDSHQAPKVEP